MATINTIIPLTMKRITVFSTLLIAFVQLTVAQNATTASVVETTAIMFEKSTHDFGEVNEGGPITYEFKFTNKGKAPLTISNVRASCGCTTPGWTTEPVLPGKTGVITAQYNTANRPGAFNKTLTVTANTEPAITILTIKGNVLPKVKTPEELYPKKVGSVRMFSDYVYIGRITTKEPVVKEVVFYNDGNTPITFNTHDLPEFIQVSFSPQTIASKEKSTMKITYNAEKRKDLGPVEDKIVVLTNEENENKKLLNIVADINEYYPPLSTEEAANAPKVVFDKSIIDLGQVKAGVSTTAEVQITNSGKQDLVIKKVRSAAAHIQVKNDKEIIKAGQTGTLKITYKVDNRKGTDTQYVYVYTNDPARPTQNFTVKATIIQ